MGIIMGLKATIMDLKASTILTGIRRLGKACIPSPSNGQQRGRQCLLPRALWHALERTQDAKAFLSSWA